jgi:hypothetical protein
MYDDQRVDRQERDQQQERLDRETLRRDMYFTR